MIDIFNQVARDLPEGWRIEIHLERGYGGVSLYDQFDHEIEFETGDIGKAIAEMIDVSRGLAAKEDGK